MSIISLSGAQLAFGHLALLDQAGFALEAGERIGLIGRNGSGKSSLLNVLAGRVKLDDGPLSIQQGLTIACVDQEPALPRGSTVFDAVAAGLGEVREWLAEYRALTTEDLDGLGAHCDDLAHERMHQLQIKLDTANAWNLSHRVETTLDRLGLEAQALVETLSGGEQKRVALARALVSSPEVLLLDEPTNHLDLKAIIWLEGLLRDFKGSVLFVTHDRSFLDNLATRIVELDRGRLLSFPGNFSAYKKHKAEQLAIEAIDNAKFDKFLAQEEVWIRKGIEARRTRDEGRVRRLESLRIQRNERRELQGRVRIAISAGERSGKIVAELERVSKRYGEREIVRDFSATILRGDKVGLIGANGAGKTTLLKVLLGQTPPDQGSVRLGSKLQIAYFDQMRAQLNDEASLADTIAPGSDWVEVNGQRKHVMTYLGDFLFAPERARSPVKSLSGGERNRLLLARLFAKPANVLVLDEPTNDLDIDTLELLEEMLEEFEGTIFLVSHDRVFLDNVVTQVIAAEGEGTWREYVGGYSDWERVRASDAGNGAHSKVANRAARAPAAPTAAKPRKLNNKELRELESLPGMISQLENEQKAISQQLSNPGFYKQAPQAAHDLGGRFTEIEALLLEYLERWESLESRANSK